MENKTHFNVRIGLLTLHNHVWRLVLEYLVRLDDLASLFRAPGQHQSEVGKQADARQVLQRHVRLLHVHLQPTLRYTSTCYLKTY